jgi:hypothetical protein
VKAHSLDLRLAPWRQQRQDVSFSPEAVGQRNDFYKYDF